MNIEVILGSQRVDGTCDQIEIEIKKLTTKNKYNFIKMSDVKIEACIACTQCSKTGQCVLPPNSNDMFQNILERLKIADTILVITPIYSPYPSKLVALMERLLSVSYFGYEFGKIERPLKNKKAAIFCYGSTKIEDEKQLKLLFQKYFMDKYSFTEVSYNYLNNENNPNSNYSSINEYVIKTIQKIENKNI
jgi:multimeric flavodoxin WrbA